MQLGGQSSRSTQVVDHWTEERIRLEEKFRRADIVYKCQLKELNYSKKALEKLLKRKREAGQFSVQESEQRIKSLRREIGELKSFNHKQSKIRLPPIYFLQAENKERENLKRLLQDQAVLKLREESLKKDLQLKKGRSLDSEKTASMPVVLQEEVLKVKVNDLRKELSRVKRKDELLSKQMLSLLEKTRAKN